MKALSRADFVKRIVDAHRAGIAVTSDVGHGTTARISVSVAA